MGNNEKKDTFFEKYKESLKENASEKLQYKVHDGINKEINRAFQNKEINFSQKQVAKYVPKAIFTASNAANIAVDINEINNDYKKTGNLTFAVAKNQISSKLGDAAGKFAGAGARVGTIAAIEYFTDGAATPIAITAGNIVGGVTDVAVDSLVSKGVESAFDSSYKFYKKSKQWIKYYDELAKFKKLEPAKYDTSNKPIAGVANSTGVTDNTQMMVTYPQPVVSENPLGWMAQLGNILSGTANLISSGFNIAAGAGTGIGVPTGLETPIPKYWRDTNAVIVKHTGGIVAPKHKGGRNEMLALLQGGETVRTEAQEKELQDSRTKELLETYAPLVSGENDENNPYAQVFGANQSKKKDPKTPVLANKTTHDEETIIAIIADAWKSNRSGFRNVLRYS